MTKGLARFYNSLKIQLRVIYALLMREIITRYGRHNLGFAWLFVEPMIFTLAVAGFWNLTKSVHGDSTLPIIPFAVTGYSCVLLWRNAASRVGNAVQANTGLLYHRNVKPFDVIFTRVLLEMIGATFSFIILSTILILTGVMDLPVDFFRVIMGWLLLAWFSVGLGFVVAGLSELSEVVDRLWHTVTYILFPLSGTAFFVYWLPERFRPFVLALPMVHGTEMIRHGYYGDLIPTFESVSYFIKADVFLLFLGMILVRYVSKKIEAQS